MQKPKIYVSEKQERYFKYLRYTERLDKYINMPESTFNEMCKKIRKLYGLCYIYSKNLKELLEQHAPNLIEPFIQNKVLTLCPETNEYSFNKDILEQLERTPKETQLKYNKEFSKCVNMPESTPIEMCGKLRKFYEFCCKYSKNLKEVLEQNASALIEPFTKIKVLVLEPDTDNYTFSMGTLEQFEDMLLAPDDEPDIIPYYPELEKVTLDNISLGLFD